MITSVAATGTTVQLGTVLYSVESLPVVALAGTLPAWRTLSTSSADGPDVFQLELSLKALGYDPTGKMTVDSHFDSHTKAAVKAWQAGYGLPVTGTVALGSVVFLPANASVSDVKVKVGDSVGNGDGVLTLAASSQQVVIDVPAGDEPFMVPGLAVKIGAVDGTVTSLHSVVRSGAAVVQAVITPSGPVQAAGNGSTVKVTVTIAKLDNALVVPSAAVASRIDGSYALQVVGAGGSTTWVRVEVLGVSGSNAAVRGAGITAGTKVLEPTA
jgi:peptidoglycan hydrolase-like protein with peptidoglycan-binding domain